MIYSTYTGFGVGCMFYCPTTKRALLCKRSGNSDYPNTWCIVGGGVEPGEDDLQALTRECREEIGMYPNDTLLYPMYKSTMKNGFEYNAKLGITNQEFVPSLNSEHSDYGWFFLDHLPDPLHPVFEQGLNTRVCQRRLKDRL